MGLFSNLFKSNPKATCDTTLGLFTLVYSRGVKNTWSNNSGEVLLSVRGSTTEPDASHLQFLKVWQAEVNKLSDRITKRFIREFKEADLPVDFSYWSDKFKIVAVEVMLIFEQEAFGTLHLRN